MPPTSPRSLIRNLASPEVQSQTDAQLTDRIANGGPDKKPAHAYKKKGLSDEQISALVAFSCSLKK